MMMNLKNPIPCPFSNAIAYHSLVFLSKIWGQILTMENDDDIEMDEDESSNTSDDKLNPSTNSEENDKLKTYPCTQCGKVIY